jgi:cell division protein FtsB
MAEKLREFKSLNAKSGVSANPKLTAVKVELAQVDAEIEKLVESLTGASATLIQFANRKADELSARRQSLTKEIADLSTDEIPAVRLTAISDYLDDWDNTSLDDKRQVLDGLITVISAKSDNIEIEWKI